MDMKKVFLASDHAGYELKSALGAYLTERGYTVDDVGPANYDAADDYPDTIGPLARAIADDSSAMGIVIGASGQGEAMVCNRLPGVRAAVYYGGNKEIITLSRQHNNVNVLSLGAKFLTQGEAKEAVLLWLQTDFSSEERHMRRIGKLN
jgi:ribose 5-phosphate isomerase B